MARLLKTLIVLAAVFWSGEMEAQAIQKPHQSSICGLFPGGRIAMASDGNNADADDHGATAMAIAMLHYAGLLDKLVYIGHSSLYKSGCNNDFGDWCDHMDTSTTGAMLRLGGDTSIIYSYQKDYNDNNQLDQSIAAFTAVINASSASDPLWIYCAGPMDVVYRAIDQASPAKRAFVKCISHSSWNENSKYGGLQYNWSDLKSDFSSDGVQFFEIADQNNSNGRLDFRDESSPAGSNWSWLTSPSAPPFWSWLRNRNLDLWFPQNNKAGSYDISDAGMMYWLISGGPASGCENCGTLEVEQLFTNPCSNSGLGGTVESMKQTVQVYPNPTYDLIQIDIPIPDPMLFLKLYSMNGDCLGQIHSEGASKIQLDLRDYTNGIYLLKLESPEYSESIRILKME